MLHGFGARVSLVDLQYSDDWLMQCITKGLRILRCGMEAGSESEGGRVMCITSKRFLCRHAVAIAHRLYVRSLVTLLPILMAMLT